MKRISKIFSVVFCLILLAGLGAQLSAASAPYETYTYSIDGMALTSPHAYTPSASITSYEMNLSTALNAPRDIFVDENGKIYISDTGNNRVVVCNSSFVIPNCLNILVAVSSINGLINIATFLKFSLK